MRAGVVRYKDNTGRVRWQPMIAPRGDCLFFDLDRGARLVWTANPSHRKRPILHRWRRLAKWRASREVKRRLRQFEPG